MPNITRRDLFAGTSLAFALPLSAGTGVKQRNLLAGKYSIETIQSTLLPASQWKPFPRASDHAQWKTIPDDVRLLLIQNGEKALQDSWPTVPATAFLDYVRIGNRTRGDGIRSNMGYRLRDLVFAECIEHKGRFLDGIMDGIWAICEMTYWGSPAHLNLQKHGRGLPDFSEPTVDLFAAETGAMLAWTDYLLAEDLEKASSLLRPRIHAELRRRILEPCWEREDFWWMGFSGERNSPPNNWNPWINSNWLTVNLLRETDSARRVKSVYKSLRSLDKFLDGYHDDGGCDEGPGYWGHAGGSLFDCLEILHSASTGKISVYDHPLIAEIGRYIVRAHIYGRSFTNFADAPAKVNIYGDLVFRYGKRVGDKNMQQLGAEFPGTLPGYNLGRGLPAIFNVKTIRAAEAKQPLLRDVWFPGIQVMTARIRQGSPEGLYLAVQGGHNNESHNHNDVGNFLVYADGHPAIIDVGVETYTAKTFSSSRYDIWTMQSAWHNLPTVNGVMQNPGREYEATDVTYEADDAHATISLNIARAYPPVAGIKTWQRTVTLTRPNNEITVNDAYKLNKGNAEIVLTLMTPCKPDTNTPGKVILRDNNFTTGPVTITYDKNSFLATYEEKPIEDVRLKSSWGDVLSRILLKTSSAPAEGNFLISFTQS